MVDPQIVKEWLDKADRNFQFATESLKRSDGFYELLCYHFQQAGEKYLKAYIVANELDFTKIHDLAKLLQICKKKNSDFENLKTEAKFLTDFYLEPRYPNGLLETSYTKDDAIKAQVAARKIGDFVKKLLSKTSSQLN